ISGHRGDKRRKEKQVTVILHRAFEKPEHTNRYKPAQKRQNKPRQTRAGEFENAIIGLDILRDTGGELVIFIGFLLDYVDDVIDGDSSYEPSHFVGYRNRFQVIFLHDPGDFAVFGINVDRIELPDIKVVDWHFRRTHQKVFERQTAFEPVFVIDHVN